MRKMVIIFVIAFIFGGVSFYYVLHKNAELTWIDNRLCELELNIAKAQKNYDTNDLYLFIDQMKTLEKTASGEAYFTLKVNPVTKDNFDVTILINNDSGHLADAANIQLNFDNTIKVKEIVQGDAFPIYPRTVINDDSVVISGIASLTDDKLQFGRLNNIYATLKLSINREVQDQKATITLNKEATNIFLMGKSIINVAKTIGSLDF